MNEGDDDFIQAAHDEAVEWARDLLQRAPSSWCILDTETTGLGLRDEVIQIGVIDGAGNVLMDNVLVRPTVRISDGARAVHGISPEDVKSAPSFAEVLPALNAALDGRLLVIYNADYDIRMLKQSAQANGVDFYLAVEFHCAMIEYARWYGEWYQYQRSFRWQRLPEGDHTAVGDCRSVLKLIRRMYDGEGE